MEGALGPEDFAKVLALINEVFHKQMNADAKNKVIKRLLSKIEVGKDFVRLHYFVGEETLKIKNGELPLGNSPFFSSQIGGSRTLTNGGFGPTTDEPAPRPISPLYFHDIIEFLHENEDRKIEILRPLYMQGMSLRDIERQTGIPKTSARELLIAHGLPLRNFSLTKKKNKNTKKGMCPGVAPYGYGYLDGQLVMVPNEYKNVQKILKLWQKGKGAKSISEELNGQRLLTRASKKWSPSTIARVIHRHENSTNKSEKL